jgi:glyoxylase-like metal-dependent hydrolase (beta-lactamase superfamily II)
MVTPVGPILAEIGESTWRLQDRVGERNVYQYLLASADRDELLLIDTGTAETPRNVVVPALRRLALRETAMRLIVVTHPDVDHQGGLAGLREACENAVAACGFADRAMVADPEKLLADRYGCYSREHGIGLSAEELRWVRARSGARVEIDVTFSGRERVNVGERQLDVLRVPGHSAGHLALYEPDTGLLFSSDAIHWRACPAADGSPALCPTYEEVDDYLATIDTIESLAPAEMHSGHWPMRSGREVLTFLRESREFVEKVDLVLRERLREPATLAQLCEEVQAQAGPWDSEPGMLRFAVAGHLRRLVATGSAAPIDVTSFPLRFSTPARNEPATPTRDLEARVDRYMS